MFNFREMAESEWIGFGEPFADGGAPLIAPGLRIDGFAADLIVDGRGVTIVWANNDDEESFIASIKDAAAARVLALLRPNMTRTQLAAVPGVQIDSF